MSPATNPDPTPLDPLLSPDAKGRTEFHRLAREGRLTDLGDSLSSAVLSIKDLAGRTPVHYAAHEGHLLELLPFLDNQLLTEPDYR